MPDHLSLKLLTHFKIDLNLIALGGPAGAAGIPNIVEAKVEFKIRYKLNNLLIRPFTDVRTL